MAFENPFLKSISTTAGQFGSSGPSDIGSVSNFYRTLLGGNRQQIMQQAAPAANAAREMADASKREQAKMGTARTGGTAAGNQQIEDEVRRQIDSIIGQQQAQAAQGLKGVSDTELQTMMNALGIGASTAQSDINSRRAASAQMWDSLIGGAGKILGAGIGAGWFSGGGGGGGGGVPGPTFQPIAIGDTAPVPPLYNPSGYPALAA
jgi:hypothetical protein